MKSNKHKRLNGEGSLRLRPDGRYEYRIMTGYNYYGKPISKSFYGKTATEAIKKYHQYIIGLANEKKTVSNVKFSEFANTWYTGYKGKVQETTYTNYKFTLDKLIEKFGNMDLASIKAMDIEEYINEEIDKDKSPSAISKEKAMMYQIMKRAVANDIIDKNPVEYVDKTRNTGPIMVKDSFTVDEVKKLFRELPDTLFGNAIRLMLSTGMRTQELLALEPKHLDVDNKVVHIVQAIKNVNGCEKIGCTKSRDSYRDVFVPDFIVPVMEKLKQTPFQFIFQLTPDSGPCTEKTFRKKFKEILQDLEIRDLSPHCCRHTYVSQMQSIGVSMQTIQSLVGHADMKMTEHYLHVQDPVKTNAVTSFGSVFCPN